MSISIEKLSLLGALAPLRQKSDSNIDHRESGFADRLIKAIGSTESSASSAGSKAIELAESLTVQMLQSSLVLSGDPFSDNAATSDTTPFSSSQALLSAYRVNLASGGDPLPSTPVATPSQLQELTDAARSSAARNPRLSCEGQTAVRFIQWLIIKADYLSSGRFSKERFVKLKTIVNFKLFPL